MKSLDMNTIISWGLVVMGTCSVVGWIIISMQTGTSSGTEVPISIISGLVGVLTGKNLSGNKPTSNSPTGETLGKIADTATEAKKVVDAVEMIGDIVKKG